MKKKKKKEGKKSSDLESIAAKIRKSIKQVREKAEFFKEKIKKEPEKDSELEEIKISTKKAQKVSIDNKVKDTEKKKPKERLKNKFYDLQKYGMIEPEAKVLDYGKIWGYLGDSVKATGYAAVDYTDHFDKKVKEVFMKEQTVAYEVQQQIVVNKKMQDIAAGGVNFAELNESSFRAWANFNGALNKIRYEIIFT